MKINLDLDVTVTRTHIATAEDKLATARLTVDVKAKNFREAEAFGNILTAFAALEETNKQALSTPEISFWKNSGTITVEIECVSDAHVPAAREALRRAIKRCS